MLKYSVTGYGNYKSCSEKLNILFEKNVTDESELNMNDTRFKTENKSQLPTAILS
jgi:hypothetical protein